MTIQEAIKSGKPFRRKKWKSWALEQTWVIKINRHGHVVLMPHGIECSWGFPRADILATDWEVKENP